MATNGYQRLLLSASVVLVTGIGATLAHAQAVNTFPTPTAASRPFGITAGPDGALWYTELNANKIGRILPTGVTGIEFPIPTAAAQPTGITTGPDGNLWFAEIATSKIGRITPDGVITEFPTFTPASGSEFITTGPDGNLWFTEPAVSKIGCITPAGAFCNVGVHGEIATHTVNSSPRDITVGADGNLWFTEEDANKIGCITTAGAFCSVGTFGEIAVATLTSFPTGIAAGPDGNLWFTEQGTQKIGCITTAGTFCSIGTNGEVATSPGSNPFLITAGPNGALWFTEVAGNRIGRITTAGVISEFSTGIPAGSQPIGITAGPGGNLWFTEQAAGASNIASFVLNNSHDYNGDGVSDILFYSTFQEFVGMWQMAANPTLTPPLGKLLFAGGFQGIPSQWSPIGQGQFIGNFAMANGTVAPGNGDADILWRDTSGNLGMWLMNSTTIVSGGATSSVPTNWSVVGVGDLNGDGKADLVWQDNQGDLGIWLNTSTKFTTVQGLTFNSTTLGALPTQWKVVGSDKYGDIFLQSCPSGTCVGGQVSMWVMNGSNIENIVNLGTPANFSVAGLGDFDGNGSEDVLLTDGSGGVGIWLLRGGKIINAGPVVPPAGWPASNWSIVQTGDFNGDGFSDILFFDGSGTVGIWYMKGLNAVAFTTLSFTPGNGWVPQGLNSD